MKITLAAIAILAAFGWAGEHDYQDKIEYWEAFCQQNSQPIQCREFEKGEGG